MPSSEQIAGRQQFLVDLGNGKDTGGKEQKFPTLIVCQAPGTRNLRTDLSPGSRG